MSYKNIKLRFLAFVFAGIMVALFAVTLSTATTIVELSLKDLCMASSDIIIARVVTVKSYLHPVNGEIYSDIQLEVEGTIKGQFQNQDGLELTVYGGTVNGITSFIVGAPQFRIDEQSVFFLSEGPPVDLKRNFSVVGLSQGKFDIFIDKKTGEEKVVRELDLPLQLEKNGPRLSLTTTQAIRLKDFEKYIRERL